jgi:acyl-CoA thioesterase-2
VGDLSTDTAVTGRDGRYTADISRDWEIWGPNGGYIASIALRAAGEHSRFDRPASIVGHFLGVADFAPVAISVQTRRGAKRAEAMRVEISQRGEPIFDAMVWAVGDVAGLEHDATERPARPDPDTLPTVADRLASIGEVPNMYHRFWSNFDERVPDEDWIDDWPNRAPGAPVAGHWYRYVPASTFDDPWVDACRSLLLIDTLGWPAVCRLHLDQGYIAPSIDISCAFHRFDASEPWLYVRASSPSGANGLIGCEGRVWSRRGELLAVGASQLLCRPAPAP